MPASGTRTPLELSLLSRARRRGSAFARPEEAGWCVGESCQRSSADGHCVTRGGERIHKMIPRFRDFVIFSTLYFPLASALKFELKRDTGPNREITKSSNHEITSCLFSSISARNVTAVLKRWCAAKNRQRVQRVQARASSGSFRASLPEVHLAPISPANPVRAGVAAIRVAPGLVRWIEIESQNL